MFYKKKILEDLPLLLEKGIIDEKSKLGMENYYALEGDSVYAKAKTLSLYLIGIVFVCIAAALFIRYNWSVFPVGVKDFLMYVPLIASVPALFYAFKAQTQLSYVGALVLNLVGVILLLLVPKIIYNIEGSPLDFFTALLFLFCPVAILSRQSLGLLLACIVLLIQKTALLDIKFLEGLNLGSFAFFFFFVILSYLLLTKKSENFYGTFLNTISAFLLFLSFMISEGNPISKLFIATFALGAIGVYLKKLNFSVLALVIFTVLAVALSTIREGAKDFEVFFGNDAFLNLSVVMTMLAGVGFFIWSACKGRKTLELCIVGLFLAQACVYSLAVGEDSEIIRKFLCNVSSLGLFALVFTYGIKEKSIKTLNLSFFVILLYSVFKFFDSNWTLLERSGLFLAVGITMIVSNIILNKRIKEDENA